MDRIKRFIDCYIPTETCNLRCHYCYITQKRKFNAKIATLSHTPATIRKALSVERLGGVCLLNMCAGGETLLSEDILPIVRELLTEGHYVMIVTNGTMTNRFEEVAQWPKDLLSRLFFKFSFHFLEMKRLNWMDRFFANVDTVKRAGASFTIEVTPTDELIPYIDELKETCMRYEGALCHLTIARDDRTNGIDILSEYSFDDYMGIWGVFDSALLEFKARIYHQKRNEYCYAGDWSMYLNLETGRLTQCYGAKMIDNIYDDPGRPLHFEAVGCRCKLTYCYNGHAFLALGTIPGLESPTFAEERNRVCVDGSEWLGPEMKAFMSSRLYETNKEYSAPKKAMLYIKQKVEGKGLRRSKVVKKMRRMKRKMFGNRSSTGV